MPFMVAKSAKTRRKLREKKKKEVQQTLLNTLWREDTGLLGGAGVCVCVCVEGNGNPLQYSCLGNPMDREN